MESGDPSSTSDASVLTDSPVVNSARLLLWARSHGPLVALALFVLYDGGSVSSIMGALC